MNTKFKRITLFSAVALIGLGAFTACHRHHPGKDHSDHMIKKLDRIADRLDIEGEQKNKYQELRGRILADLKAGHQARLEGMRKIKAEFQKPEPDIDAVAAELKSRMDQGHARFAKAPDYMREFYNILNAEQKAEVKEFVLDRLEDI